MTATKALSQKDMNGLTIINLGNGVASTDAATKGQLDTGVTAAESRANHTGTQLAATISDFNAAVRTSTLNQMTAPTTDLNINSHKLTSVTDPTSAQDAATKNYVDTSLAGLASGLVLKGAVVAASTANVSLLTPGTTIDGVTATSGEIYLLTGQTTAADNGPYTFNGSASTMTRAGNWDTSAEAVLGSYWIVERGSHADQFAIMTNDSAVTVGTTALTFTFVTTGSGGGGGYTTTSPSTAAGASWTVTHSLGTRALVIQIYRTASPFDGVDVYAERTDTNTVTIKPDIAMASGEYTVVIAKAV